MMKAVHHQSFEVVLVLYNFISFQANTHLNCNNFDGLFPFQKPGQRAAAKGVQTVT